MKEFLFNIKSFLKNYRYILKYKLVWSFPLILFLLFLDWLSKGLVTSTMQLGEAKNFIPKLINFKYAINPGAAYGMNADSPTLAISIASVVTVLMILAFVFIKNKWWLIGLCFMLSGSMGNLIGRLWAPPTRDGVYGGVVDFLVFDFSFLGSSDYIFNLADVWVTASVIIIATILIVYFAYEIYEFRLKKNEILFEIYIDIKSQKTAYFEVYWSTFYRYKIKEKISYKQYLLQIKKFKEEWKTQKGEKLNEAN